MARHKLTAAAVKNAGAGKHEDGEGLRLVKRDRDGGKWVLRYQRSGRRREMGLGSWPALSLAEARLAAEAARTILAQGDDPILHRERERRRASRADTSLTAMTLDCFEARKAELRDDGKAGRWLSPLQIHVLPKIGTVPVQEIDAALIRETLAPIWHTKADTARKAANRLNLTITHAAALGVPVDMQAVQKARALLGQSRHKATNIPAMPWAEVPAFYQSLADLTSCHLALRLLILTGMRSTPVRFLTLDQIDGDVWTVPSDKMKGREGKTEDFAVPLSAEALAVIEAAKSVLPPPGKSAKSDKTERLLFPGKTGKPISDVTMSKHMRDKGFEARPHGFRTSLREWADHVGARFEVAETLLAHKVHGALASAYLRTDYLDERRALLVRWAQFVTAGGAGENVVAFG
jgi:integrase